MPELFQSSRYNVAAPFWILNVVRHQNALPRQVLHEAQCFLRVVIVI
jgi:hypothetical protein